MKIHVFSLLTSLVLTAATAAAFEPDTVGVHPTLANSYASFFPPEVLTVTEGVYVARGFNRDNPALIEGVNGLIIVDPGESIPAALAAKAAFSAHLNNIFERKPVKAIIYTHHHDCHINGAAVYANEKTEIYAHENLMSALFDEWFGQVFPSRAEGGIKMSGALFQNDPGWYAGGVLFGVQVLGPSGFLPPTKTVKNELKTTIAGVDVRLINAPGETRDIVLVWLPQKKVLIEIGIIYKSFPAVTTMRGSGQRNPLEYVSSLKLCRSLEPEYLVTLHGGEPITAGKENVHQFLTDFSDAIQFMHDQTIQFMNKGYTPGEIKDLIVLPPHLAGSPYLQETYGRLDWDIYHIFRLYRGYYTGKIRDLFPQSPLSAAELAAELAGGINELAAKAEQAFATGKLEWALELADDVLLLDPDNTSAYYTKANAMLSLAEQTMNAQARNTLLSDYLLMTGQLPPVYPWGKPKVIFGMMDNTAVRLMPITGLHRIMAVNLNASKSGDKDIIVRLRFSDLPKNSRGETPSHMLQVRRGIFEVDPPNPGNAEFVISTDSLTWKQLGLAKLSPAAAIASGTVEISGAMPADFYAFMELFY